MSWTWQYFLFNVFLKTKIFASVWKVDNTFTRFRAERPLFDRCAHLLPVTFTKSKSTHMSSHLPWWCRCSVFVHDYGCLMGIYGFLYTFVRFGGLWVFMGAIGVYGVYGFQGVCGFVCVFMGIYGCISGNFWKF